MLNATCKEHIFKKFHEILQRQWFQSQKVVVLVFDRYDLEKLSKEFSVFISGQAFESSQF